MAVSLPTEQTTAQFRGACPLCGEASRYVFSKNAIAIRQCQACQHRFADVPCDREHVQSIYSDQYFTGGGAGYSDYLNQAALLRQRGRDYARLLQRHTRPGIMLDVGAAAGFILAGFHDAGWSGEGIEPNRTMAQAATDLHGLTVHAVPLEEFTPSQQFDLISLIQVLPHFYDPVSVLRQVAEMLFPGGLCLIETWNRKSVVARVFGRTWHEYSPPSVLHWFSRQGIASGMRVAGLEYVAGGRPGRWVEAAHAASLMKHLAQDSRLARMLSPLLGWIPEGLRLPYPGDDLMWLLYRRPGQ